MNEEIIIKRTEAYVKRTLKEDRSGHDWWHIYRVQRNAIEIGKRENANIFIIRLAALLHDIADWKFHRGDDSTGSDLARKWLEKMKIEESAVSHICEIIKDLSFMGAGIESKMKTKEGMIVQDADRLDAIGAIGIARAFATGAKFNEIFYEPSIPVPQYKSAQEYITSKGKEGRTVVNHFYEKLLLLKDLMNTKSAKRIARKRHKFMEKFLDEFLKEWEGES